MKSDRDKEQVKYLRTMLKDVNEKAAAYVNRSGTNLIMIGRHFKSLIDDHDRPHHEVVLNWKELENASPRPLRDWLVEVYKKIYYMVQLLQYYAKEGSQQ